MVYYSGMEVLEVASISHVPSFLEREDDRPVATRLGSWAFAAYVQASSRGCQEDGGQCQGGGEEEWEGEQVCAQAGHPKRKGDAKAEGWLNEGGPHRRI